MTGNNKVWRAPLAGLASLAMIATMGVAAGTASAAGDEFTVKFDANGHGTAPSSLTANEGNDYKVGGLNKISANGWVFTGWYTSPNLGEGELFDTQSPVLEDTTLYAHWAKTNDVYTVSFNANGVVLKYADTDQDGTANNAGDKNGIKVAKGDKLAAWEAPTDGSASDGHKLTGFVGSDGNAFDFTQAVTGKLTAKAEQTVSTEVVFDASTLGHNLSGETSTTKTVEVANGDNVELPTAVAGGVPGHEQIVEKWYIDGNTSKLWEGGAAVKSDGSYYKKLTLKPGTALTDRGAAAHKITFAFPGSNPTAETAPAPIWVADNTGATLPTPNTYGDKLVFDGWYKAGTDSKLYDDEPITADVTVNGYLTIGNVQFTVSFDPDYTGSKPTEVKVAKGATATKPADPTRDGYVFAGWALDGDSDNTLLTPAYYAPVYKSDADFRGYRVYSASTFKALWLTSTQVELKGLLDVTGEAYNQDTQAWADFSNKQGEIAGKADYTTGSATVTAVKGLSHVSEKAAKDYIAQLTALKAKLTATDNQFLDVFTGNNGQVSTPHYNEIFFVAEQGIAKGYGDGTFKPTGSMFRQDYAAFLYRLAGSPEYTPAASDNIFTDVTPATPHYKEILWAAKNGIVKGFSDGTFRGMALVNRQDAAAFLYRAAGSPEFDPSTAAKQFSDVNESTPHYKEVLWAANTVVDYNYKYNGVDHKGSTAIVNGFATGTFDGYATLLRQDGAAFLARTYFYINK
ncbi:InlB B-repeat-containing protein [Bifidobacterium miconisargentati]|uniref:InlB B-repeat-containing protein n=1 Tax=Bifidobacterium miconisargentati TaxID=2834437 RepID=UPI001BDD5577|nr:InlB B-repeat-containing protein [Bifidobacterium miconisargentati]MBW3091145.1 InlB B-repeat-containing protein [Bifidobacterium miconisargentati]